MRLSNKRYDEIQRSAYGIFARYGIDCIPIDCFRLCEKMGIVLRKYSDAPTNHNVKLARKASKDGFCAEIEYIDEKGGTYTQWYVFYDDTMPSRRVRFTIMHEVGHIVLDHSEHSALAEAEANFFAAKSLAPLPLVHNIAPEDYLDIAEGFDISDDSALIVMQNYVKWLRYGSIEYLDYEYALLIQFGLAS